MKTLTAYVLRFVNKIKQRLLRCAENYEERDKLNASNLEDQPSGLLGRFQNCTLLDSKRKAVEKKE